MTSNLIGAAFAVSSEGDGLPADFDYSAREMHDAIVGSWVDSQTGITLQLESLPGAPVEYEVAAEGYKCTTTAVLAVRGTLSKNDSAVSTPAEGSFVGLLRLSDATLELSLGQAPNATPCSLNLTEADASTRALTGTCDLSLVGLESEELLLVR